MLDIQHVSLSYDGVVALDDVSLDVKRNETVSIIGPTGSGKSTLLHCISGLVSYDSGSLTVGGMNPAELPRGDIGMVFQENNLFPHMTVLQNMTVAPVHVHGRSRSESEAEALELLSSVGMWERKGAYPGELSLGQRQRVAIARSMMMHPQVLLLDEPTASLDLVSASEVADVIRGLKKNDMTIVLVTHNIDLAVEVSDRIVFMCDGKVCESGTPQQISDNPQDQRTRDFMTSAKCLVYEVKSEQYDHPELNARIEHFCGRYRLGTRTVHSIQLVVEELLNILPLEEGLTLTVSKSRDDIHLLIDISMPFSETDYLDEESVSDDLSYTIIRGMCDSIEEGTDESGDKHIHVEIRGDVL